jgi:hypothetical protein
LLTSRTDEGKKLLEKIKQEAKSKNVVITTELQLVIRQRLFFQ